MPRIDIKLREEYKKLEVGDIVINPTYGTRFIVRNNEEYLGVDLVSGQVFGSGKSLSQLERMYCKNDYKIIKSDDVVISELGGSK